MPDGQRNVVRNLRLNVFDVLVGINLLREGLDIPEITLVAILDADKEGFLRSETSLIQTIGRAARNSEGHVIMYADRVSAFISVELSMGQMIEDVELATRCKRPVYLCNRTGGMIPSPEQVLAKIKEIAGGLK